MNNKSKTARSKTMMPEEMKTELKNEEDSESWKKKLEELKVETRKMDEEVLNEIKAFLDDKHMVKLRAYLEGTVELVSKKKVKYSKMQERLKDYEKKVKELEEKRIQTEIKTKELAIKKKELEKDLENKKELAKNIEEETSLIQSELENLTQVLFEEANKMVSTESRSKHEMEMSKETLKNDIEKLHSKLEDERKRLLEVQKKLEKLGEKRTKIQNGEEIGDNEEIFMSVRNLSFDSPSTESDDSLHYSVSNF